MKRTIPDGSHARIPSGSLKALYDRALPAKRTGHLYRAFPYPTKIPPEAIALFIAAHTKPGDTVFDGFAGSGTTGLAALLCEDPPAALRAEVKRLGLSVEWGARNAVLYELGALGAFVGQTLANPPDPLAFQRAAEDILHASEAEDGWMYGAKGPEGQDGMIRYLIWSDLLRCPACRHQATLWDCCVSLDPAQIAPQFTCPSCAHEAPVDEVERLTRSTHDDVLGGKRQVRARRIARVYGSTGKMRWSREATRHDLSLLKRIEDAPIPDCVPRVAIAWGDLYRRGYHLGISHLHHFYTRRNLIVFARLWERTERYRGTIRDALRFWLLSYNTSHATTMTRVVAKTGQKDLALTSAQPGVLYVSGLPVEKNLFAGLRRKLSTIASAFTITFGGKGRVEVYQASSCRTHLPDHKVDYVFTDPPFGGNIPYAEVSFINEAWLGRFTDRAEEIVVSNAQGKAIREYQELLKTALSEARRILKPDGKTTLVFHSASAGVWNALQAAYTAAGFGVECAGVLDKTQGSFKQVTTGGAVRGDPVLLLSKRVAQGAQPSPCVWTIAEQLWQEAAIAKDPEEQTAQRLYSRLVSHFLTRHQRVPLSADSFYRWHEERHGYEARRIVRSEANAYEQALDPARRKSLGQFFTGVPLGKLLAHLALRPDTRTVLDPMVGHGDLLDATSEAAAERGIPVERLDGIEIDKPTADVCRHRLAASIPKVSATDYSILTADAFNPTTPNALPVGSYDLVITNPPYVRYQTRRGRDAPTDPVRAGLKHIVNSRHGGAEGTIWRVLAQSYSGLADLSVPAWILAGSLVRPGGRLALVAPATWRSRNYADAIRYLLLRCFVVEAIVADTQPGWFSDALVRTHLIIARRSNAAEARQRLSGREHWPKARWLQVDPSAADERSLVGAAFEGEHPEVRLADWVHGNAFGMVRGIEVRAFDLRNEWEALHARIERRRWYRTLEGDSHNLPLFATCRKPVPPALPDALRDMLPSPADTAKLIPLDEARIKVGQGLRTGCNRFFYVTACGTAGDGSEQIRASPALGAAELTVPSDALQTVLHRQAEMQVIARGQIPRGRVLDLRAWVLPEDSRVVEDASPAYAEHRTSPPQVMPAELAEFVRRAATISLDGSNGKLIPQLSAVRTNVRKANHKGGIPRFWYMLPDFAPRHVPAALVPRVNQGTPWVESNTDPPLVIDANFSTIWALDGGWTRFVLKALLNSIWCRAFMEAAGTPLGGGALKLEATHLREMPVPLLTNEARSALDAAGRELTKDAEDVQGDIDRIVLQALLPDTIPKASLMDLSRSLAIQTSALCAARQRA